MRVLLLIIFSLLSSIANGQRANIIVDKLQEIYKGVGTSITIEAHDCNCNDLKLEANKAEIIINEHGPDNKLCHYMIFPKKFGLLKLSTIFLKGKTNKHIGSVTLKVIRMPDPIVEVAQKTSGSVSKAELGQQVALIAKLRGVPFCGKAFITEFSVIIDFKKRHRLVRRRFMINKFNDDLVQWISQMDEGDEIYFLDIKCTMPDGVRDLNNVVRLKIDG